MTDFYSVLKASIIRRQLRAPADRQDAYNQARTAMSRKLRSFDPPLDEEEINARIDLFDSAVDKLERELELDLAGDSGTERQQSKRQELRRMSATFRHPLVREEHEEEDEIQPASARQSTSRQRESRPALPASQTANDERLPELHEHDTRREAPEESGDRNLDYDRAAPMATALSRRDNSIRKPESQDNRFEENQREAFHDEPTYSEPSTPEPASPGPEPAYRPPAYQEPAEWRQAPSVGRTQAVHKSPDRWDDQQPADVDRDDYDRLNESYAEFDDAGSPRTTRDLTKRSRSSRRMVRILSTAIAGIAVVLIGFIAFVFLPIILDSDTPPPTIKAAARKSDDRLPIAGTSTASTATRIVSDSATASEIPERNLNVAESLIVFAGRDPTIFEGSPNNPIQFDSDAEGGFARISSAASTAGARALIGPGLAKRFAGHTIRVTLLARSSDENGATTIRFAYQSGLALSHWQSVDLSSNYGSYGMIWRVPASHESNAGDYLLIEPGIPGDGTSTDIRSIKIDILAS